MSASTIVASIHSHSANHSVDYPSETVITSDEPVALEVTTISEKLTDTHISPVSSKQPVSPVTNTMNVIQPGPCSTDLLFLDLETTGLNPTEGHILEIAAVLVNSDLRIQSTFHAVIGWTPEELQLSEWCQIHQKTLINEVFHTRARLPEVSALFRIWLDKHRRDKKLILAGTSVHQDQTYLKCCMPDVLECLHYRIVDVTSIMELAKRWRPQLGKFLQTCAPTHRAMSDALASLTLLRYYRKYFFQCN